MKKVYNCCLLLGLLAGCKGDRDLIGYAQDEKNGLKKTVSFDNVTYTVQYKPAGYIADMERLSPADRLTRMGQLKGTAWFNITFKIEGYNQSPLRYQVTGIEEYTRRQDYYLNEAAKDMYMLYGNDTLYVNSYWFENNQNLLPYETMVVGFSLPDKEEQPEEDLRFSFHDKVYKNGIIKVIIRKEDLEQVPGL